jgi:hypothetical protein
MSTTEPRDFINEVRSLLHEMEADHSKVFDAKKAKNKAAAVRLRIKIQEAKEVLQDYRKSTFEAIAGK